MVGFGAMALCFAIVAVAAPLPPSFGGGGAILLYLWSFSLGAEPVASLMLTKPFCSCWGWG